VSCLRHSVLVVNLLAVPRFQEIHHPVTKTRGERISPFFETSCLCGESPGLRGERLPRFFVTGDDFFHLTSRLASMQVPLLIAVFYALMRL
jgi:hypothetical protein